MAAIGHCRFRGFSIVKVLIVLALLVATSLAIIALYAHSLQTGSAVMLRAHAANLATELAKRIGANPTKPWRLPTNYSWELPGAFPTASRSLSAPGEARSVWIP